MLAIHNCMALAVFAISLDNCDHLWGFRFSFFDHGSAVRIVRIVQACPYRDDVVYPTNIYSKASVLGTGFGSAQYSRSHDQAQNVAHDPLQLITVILTGCLGRGSGLPLKRYAPFWFSVPN